MKSNLYKQIFFRIPQFPYNASLKDCWEDLKKSISHASPDFYQLIKDVTENDLEQLTGRTLTTVLKYFNRAKYRATPFGTFSGFGLFDNHTSESPLTISAKPIVSSFGDWGQKQLHSYEFEQLIAEDRKIFANSSYYLVGDSIRYLNKTEIGFELTDTDKKEQIIDLLTYCAKPVHINTTIRKIEARYPEMDTSGLIKDMIVAQLLFTELDANVIGHDFFERVGPTLPSGSIAYVISKREQIGGHLNSGVFRHMNRLLTMLPLISGDEQVPEDLAEFKSRFIKRFDKQTIPLMMALDPELGIGYGNLDLSANTAELVTSFIKPINSRDNVPGQFKNFVWSNMTAGSARHIIHLEQFRLPQQAGTTLPLANTSSCLFTLSDDLVIIDKIGGYSVNQLTGRFSLADEQVHDFCHDMTAIEKDANPDVIFFDVAYLAESRVDNINRRKQIYDFELNILNYNAAGTPLLLNDLYINVSGQEIILRSKTLGKRVIPRMASAYNAVRSDLPLFRFLCDMMYHGIRSGFSLNLSDIFPEMAFYPRLQYYNIVLSPASWQLDKKTASLPDADLALQQYFKQNQVSRFIRCGNGDETLCLDTLSPADRQILLQIISQSAKTLLTEVILPGPRDTIDEIQRPYFAQFVLPLVHHNTIYNGSTPIEDRPQIHSVFIPGSLCLSFEVYCHPARSNDLLYGHVRGFVDSFKPHIEKWFFIRYDENGDHIRLRLFLRDSSDCGLLMKQFAHLLKEEITEGLVTDVQVTTYRRELERYHMAGMENVETHFYKDSLYVLNLLRYPLRDFERYQLCLRIFKAVIHSKVLDQDRLISWLNKIGGLFNEEHALKVDDFKIINVFLKEQRPDPGTCGIPKEELNPLTASFVSILLGCPQQRRLALFTDLMHMHINRLFEQFQRTHEMIIYNIINSLLRKPGNEFLNNVTALSDHTEAL